MTTKLLKNLLKPIFITKKNEVVDKDAFSQKFKNLKILAKFKNLIKLSKFQNISTNIEISKFLSFKIIIVFIQ